MYKSEKFFVLVNTRSDEALLLRSVIWATSENHILLWLQAEDEPYKGVEAHTGKEALDKRRCGEGKQDFARLSFGCAWGNQKINKH